MRSSAGAFSKSSSSIRAASRASPKTCSCSLKWTPTAWSSKSAASASRSSSKPAWKLRAIAPPKRKSPFPSSPSTACPTSPATVAASRKSCKICSTTPRNTPSRAAKSRSALKPAAPKSSSPSPIPASASPPPTSRASSSASIASTPRAPASWAAPAWACPSPSTSSKCMAAASGSKAKSAAARDSISPSPSATPRGPPAHPRPPGHHAAAAALPRRGSVRPRPGNTATDFVSVRSQSLHQPLIVPAAYFAYERKCQLPTPIRTEGQFMASTTAGLTEAVLYDVLVNYLVSMARTVEGAMNRALDAVTSLDSTGTSALPSEVFLLEPRINEMEIVIDEHAIRLLRRGSFSDDEMRLIVAALKITNDLERIGDLAVNLAQGAVSLREMPGARIPEELAPMALAVRAMVSKSLGALIFRNVEMATQVLEAADVVDQYPDRIFENLLATMTRQATPVTSGMQFILSTPHLQRSPP